LQQPYLIQFKSFGSSDIGYLSVAEPVHTLPFQLKRAFWSYYTPQSITRGRHAHHKLELVLVAVSGKIIVTTEDLHGHESTFVLENPDTGLYIPPLHWHVMQFNHSGVLLSLASTEYSEADYIRDYSVFKGLKAT
jgi:dTDP-4-dehydrorhamnose 3,5-epimerase-like enzyme